MEEETPNSLITTPKRPKSFPADPPGETWRWNMLRKTCPECHATALFYPIKTFSDRFQANGAEIFCWECQKIVALDPELAVVIAPTILDQFAMAAMTGDWTVQSEEAGYFEASVPDMMLEERAELYYRMARAMLKTRKNYV